jgi:hypothetical protein
VIATGWPEFSAIYQQTESATPRPLVIDGWRLLRASIPESDGFAYRGIGIGRADHDNSERLRHFVEQLTRPKSATAEVNETAAKAAAK